MTTSDVKITPGSGVNVATFDITEDSETKKIQRIAVTDSAGTAVAADATHGLKVLAFIDGSSVNSNQISAFPISTGVAPVGLPQDQAWKTGMSNKGFVAPFTQLIIGTASGGTAYSAGDSISNSSTAGSVTALSATVSDTNDDPIFITDILFNSNDTGLPGTRIRAYLFNSDPTAASGVVNGDNGAYSQKKAGYIASFSGVLEKGFSDGAVGRLVPTYNDGAASGTPNAAAGGFIMVKPTSGAKTLYIQYQTVDGFSPSHSSPNSTIDASIRGWQARAS